ncbi:MAG: glycosyltransferase 2 family protein [Clostridiales bacterium]|jgi:hypothetical protein|nr:glycosyltransferase 2 family protein [Clostridiales bacterium]MDN5283687.1 glycosyltransferase 2 family protein [Candidatus Ozemobacter sp.]
MNVLKRILSISLVALIFGYLINEILNNREALEKIDWHQNSAQLFIHVSGMLLVQALLCIGWKFLLGAHKAVLSNKLLCYSFFLPNLGKYIPGKVLFLAGRIELSHRFGIKRKTGLSVFIFECLFIVTAATFYLPASFYFIFSMSLKYQAIMYSLFLLIMFWLTARIENFLTLLDKILARFKQPALEIHLDTATTRKLILYYIFVWGVYGLSCAFLASSLTSQVNQYFFPVAAAFVASWLAGFLSFLTPGGLGVRESMLIILLHPIFDNTLLMVLAILARLTWTFAELLFSSSTLLFPVQFNAADAACSSEEN